MVRKSPQSAFRRVLWERPRDPALIGAAERVAAGEPPHQRLGAHRVPEGVRLHHPFGAVPIGGGRGHARSHP